MKNEGMALARIIRPTCDIEHERDCCLADTFAMTHDRFAFSQPMVH